MTVVELVAIIGIPIAVVSMIFSAKSLWDSSKNTEKQTKINSARLSLELIKRVRDKDFAKIVDDIFDKKSKNCNQITLERFLNHFDMMAKFHEENLIDIDHIKQIYGGLLQKIRDDEHIQEKIKKDNELYQPLIRLYNKI